MTATTRFEREIGRLRFSISTNICALTLVLFLFSALCSGTTGAILYGEYYVDGFDNSGIINVLSGNSFGPVLSVGPPGGPGGMAFDADGNLFVANASSAGAAVPFSIYKLTPSGSMSTFATGNANLSNIPEMGGLAFDSHGNLFVAAGPTIYEYAPNGSQSTFGTVPGQAEGLAFDSHGNLFAADVRGGGISLPSIYKFTPTGTRSTFTIQAGDPWGLAFDAAGNLFAADSQAGNNGLNGAIYKFTSAGSRSTFATGLALPAGLAFDSSGNLFAAADAVFYKYAPDGSRTSLGGGISEGSYLAYSVSAPEPSTFVLGFAGVAILGLATLRKKFRRA